MRVGRVQLDGVAHSYRGGPPVLVDVRVEISAGDVLVVHGRNGAGKTTLLRVAAGVLRPRAGSVERSGRTGYLPQRSDELPPRLSATAWLRALSRMTGERDESGRVGVLRLLGVEHVTAPMDTLSVGTIAKVLLSAAVGGGPDVLVLDEPFAALDAPARRTALSLMASAAHDGAAVVVSDHDGAALEVATHVGTISAGRLTVVAAAQSRQRVHIQATRADGSAIDRVVHEGERDAVLLEVLRDGGKVLRVEDAL